MSAIYEPRRICPKCKREPADRLLVACETCKVPYIPATKAATALTPEEIKTLAEHIVKSPLVIGGVVILVAVGLFVVDSQISKQVQTQVQKIQDHASNQVAKASIDASNQIAARFSAFSSNAESQLQRTYATVTNEIAEQFRATNVQHVVEAVAKGQAKGILENEVRPLVENFRSDAEVLRMAAHARAYDVTSYLKLADLAAGTNTAALYANDTLQEIDRSLQRDRLGPWQPLIEINGTNTYAGPFSSDELILSIHVPELRTSMSVRKSFIDVVSQMKPPGFVPYLVGFLTNETDLEIADRTLVTLQSITKRSWSIRNLREVPAWWQTNSVNYPSWPERRLIEGLQSFASTKYDDAAKSFQAVLDFDPSADLSRAHLVFSLLELGHYEEAKIVGKKFSKPGIRWAQLASIRTGLETNNVSKATVRLARFVARYPTIWDPPRQESHAWRKVDWALFKNVCETNSGSVTH